ncbi:MAG TPA: selenocysteine-specific translation elongation factor [Streptosporangiaceae bacterium]|nr:selenocysteine-specific translation elongation factor [Streptosporangiaceae bacterium]
MQVIATAGHVDHGKSTLLKALTGMDPDRWGEEKRRGLTIDLGFAWLTLPSGERIAFVDVPGHERFVPNMLAGVGPVPAVLFMVAADEGWMPQSAEHLAVVDALGIRNGLLVITRSDLADPGPALAQASAELSRSSLGVPPAVTVSAVTGAGLPELVSELDKLTQCLPVPDPGGPVRLWVDRAFTMTGNGTVVTGTLPAGTVHRGDELVVTPAIRPVRVRDIQTLGESAPAATGVARVALNLRGVSKENLARGMAIVQAGRWTTTDVIDVRICPASVPGSQLPAGQAAAGHATAAPAQATPEPGTEPAGEQAATAAEDAAGLAAGLPRTVTLHIGSARTLARVRPLSGNIARLSLRDPLPLHAGDRILLRDPGAAQPPRRRAAGIPTPAALGHAARSVPAGPSGHAGPAVPAGPAAAAAAGGPQPQPGSQPPVPQQPPVPRPPSLAHPASAHNGGHPAAGAHAVPGAHAGPGWPGVLGAVILDVTPPPLARRGAAAAAARELATWPDRPGAADLLRRHGLLRASALLAMGVRDHPEPVTGEWLADPARWSALSHELGEVLAAHAAREPMAAGLPVEAARAALGLPDRRLVTALARPPFRVSGGLLQLMPAAGGPVASGLPESVEAAVRILRADLAETPFAAPDAERLRKLSLDIRAIAAAARAGLLLRVSDQIVLAPGADRAAAQVLAGLAQPFTAAEARQALQTTRRTAIPLLEYLDRAGITERLPDDRRQLRPASPAENGATTPAGTAPGAAGSEPDPAGEPGASIRPEPAVSERDPAVSEPESAGSEPAGR